MRIKWDEEKRRLVLQKRQIDFAGLSELFSLPYLEDRRSDVPEQHRIIGFVGKELVTYVVEYREDHLGEYVWVVTGWKATRQEKSTYAQEVR